MSPTMIDAVNADNIGPDYNGMVAMRITVLANPLGQAFDVEDGNAPAAEAAGAAFLRQEQGLWSVIYCNESNVDETTGQLSLNHVMWTDPSEWPKPGAYLWAADPSGNIAAGRWKPPITPIAVQTTDLGNYDLSSVADNFPARVAGYIDGPVSAWTAKQWGRFNVMVDHPQPAPPKPVPTPPPPAPPAPEGVCTVQLPILQPGATGEPVKAVQRLSGNPGVDGIFGPVTEGYVKSFQAAHRLTVDGIVGQHTWGSLLGAPQ